MYIHTYTIHTHTHVYTYISDMRKVDAEGATILPTKILRVHAPSENKIVIPKCELFLYRETHGVHGVLYRTP